MYDSHRSGVTTTSTTTSASSAAAVVQKVHKSDAAKKDEGVSFHFYGGHSSTTTTSYSTSTRQQPQLMALPPPAPATTATPAMTNPLETQLVEIERLVQGMETYMTAASFSTLAAAVVKELELLKGATRAIRTHATSQVLASIAAPQTEV